MQVISFTANVIANDNKIYNYLFTGKLYYSNNTLSF